MTRFLLAMLHVNSMKGKVNVEAIEDALADISSGGSSLNMAYDKTMRMIESQDEGYQKLAKHTLSWVVFSDKPLTTSELQHALAIEPGKSDLNFNNITKLDIIVSACAGLMSLEKRHDIVTVHLVHETTRAYFEENPKWFGNVRPRLARLCLTYLTFQAFEHGPCETDGDLIIRQEHYPFYSYLSRCFVNCIKGHDEDVRVKALLEKFFLNDGCVAAHVQAHVQLHPYFFQCRCCYYSGSTALHLAVFYRIYSVLPVLVNKGTNDRDFYGRTPLHVAVKNAYYEGILYLLSTPGVDCNAADEDKKTALNFACNSYDEGSVRLLLAHNGIDCNFADQNGRTPITYALENRQPAIVKLLLDREDVDYKSPDGAGFVPLYYAAIGTSKACIKMLLRKPDLGVNVADQEGMTPLIWCIEHRYFYTALLLLSREDLDLHLADSNKPGLLIRAARWGQPVIVEALLAKLSSIIYVKDDNHRTALDHAAECRNWHTVEQILARYKKKIRLKHRLKDTALFHAIKCGSADRVSLVLNHVALDKSWWFINALSLSLEFDRVEVFIVLKRKLGVWMRNNPRWTDPCLFSAAKHGSDRTLAKILEYAKSIFAGNEKEFVLVRNDRTWIDVSVYETLFNMPDTQTGVPDRLSHTALYAAVRRGDAIATRILLLMGADLNTRNTTNPIVSEMISLLAAFKIKRERPMLSLYSGQPREGG
jgi:ankyrin repeat protein